MQVVVRQCLVGTENGKVNIIHISPDNFLNFARSNQSEGNE